jgi:hypothetical protein
MAMDPHDPHTNEWYALVMAGVATVAAAVWKGVFAFRRDLRMDQSAVAHGSIVDELRREVGRLSTMVTELSARLDDEIGKRRMVETENHDLRLRISHLERILESQA